MNYKFVMKSLTRIFTFEANVLFLQRVTLKQCFNEIAT